MNIEEFINENGIILEDDFLFSEDEDVIIDFVENEKYED